VEAEFQASGPGWPRSARRESGGALAASDAAAVERGELLLVLGELHVGMNSVLNPVFVKEHPRPEELIAARERDLPDPGVAPAWSRAKSRSDFYSLSRYDFDVEVGDARSWREREQVIASGELVVEEEAGSLWVRTRDHARRFEIIVFLEQHLIAESHAHFSLAAPRPHTPRVTIDALVVQRERWQLEREALGFAEEETPSLRFAAAQRFARQHRLPRRVFLKVPDELKPWYIDLHSPVYVEAASRLLRRAPSASFTEMLPDLGECWLRSADGEPYASELRMVARDEAR
jgi:hypothetical protein